jgi:hypothetical protein
MKVNVQLNVPANLTPAKDLSVYIPEETGGDIESARAF